MPFLSRVLRKKRLETSPWATAFAENMVQTAVPLRSSVKLNGKPIDVPLDD